MHPPVAAPRLGPCRPTIRAILLDLFGTVVAYGDIARGTRLSWEAVHVVACELGCPDGYHDFVPVWEEQLARPLSPEEDRLATPFLGKIARFLRSYGLPEEPAAIERAAMGCLGGWRAELFLPGDALPALQWLRASHPMALVSNFDHPPYARALLREFGLAEQFDTIVISGEVGVDKPDPRIFALALTALGCRAGEALFVGDSLEADVMGAQGAGCRPVLIDRQRRHVDYAGERIESLAELPALLARLAGA